MNSVIKKIHLEDGDIQKYELITGFNWEDVDFISPSFNKKVVPEMARLYKVNIIPKDPSFYGTLVLFHLPIEVNNLNLNRDTEIGYIFDNQILLNYYFQKEADNNKVSEKDNKLFFENKELQKIYNNLEENKYTSITKGSSSEILFLPISSKMGFLSEIKSNKVLCNSHFFLMEKTDRDSPYDELGTPHSLALKNKEILLPPLNHRECLLITNEDKVIIKNFEVSELTIKIGENEFKNNINSTYYYRPETRITPKTDGYDLIIVENNLIAINKGGQSLVPMAGFVIQTDIKINHLNSKVMYLGECEQYKFGIQVGPAMIVNNEVVKSLTCPFYKGEGVPFPSTVYPLDFNKGRAARIGIGTKDKKPILIWAEGAGKLGYVKGEESCGASLKEFALFCSSINIDNLVNLDGGGSAQIIKDGKQSLRIADRKPEGNVDAERPIPLGLIL